MKKETDYQLNAKNLLDEMNVSFTAQFLFHGYHFESDKQTRDIYKVTFAKGSKLFSLRFGQSLKDSNGHGAYKPTEYDVLTCITKNDPGTFEDFCLDFGYDTDSRSAERIYDSVVAEWQKVRKFFTTNELDELQEIQ